ncbi:MULTISPECIES: hypothetical protein [Spirulina sp. CCY15215]|uniref:hypothetical protein n=1 Tax=Spirulina sp. CCY15215 TaxID=2767591 RepID=UPI0019528FF4|nr:hypothetical protein [Spirulina major]
MAIVALKAWYIEQYEPIREIVKRPHDLRLSRSSLLKSGLRADILDETEEIATSKWFERYIEGETIEFYIEGSGGYAIANLDLKSHEIYLTKQELNAFLEPKIFFSYQQEYKESSELFREVLEAAIAKVNKTARIPLSLELAQRPKNAPLRLSSGQLRQIRKSLLFIADGTAIATTTREDKPQLLLSSNVCVELGYALHSKRQGQILLLQMERLQGQFPFDLTSHQQLSCKTAEEVRQMLPSLLEALLQRFNL